MKQLTETLLSLCSSVMLHTTCNNFGLILLQRRNQDSDIGGAERSILTTFYMTHAYILIPTCSDYEENNLMCA
jgi:hypothetical protein